MNYNRDHAVAYAHEWAFKRNPKYYNFDPLGGDCTSFISQCLFSGSGKMNETHDTGWYYHSINDRAPAWTGVEFLYRFLTANKGPGPYAEEIPLSGAQPGDIIQLSFDGNTFGHSLLVVSLNARDIFIATHTEDSDNRPLSSYSYRNCRLLHVEGVKE